MKKPTAKTAAPASPTAPGPIHFRALIQSAGKTAAGIEVPPEVVAALGAGKRPAVRVTVNGYTYRNTVAVMGGKFMLGVSNEVRAAAGVAAGQEHDFTLELDTAPREVAVPADFQAALGQNASAQRFFDDLSYTNRRRLVLAIEQAKAADTRARRIAKIVTDLQNGKA
jgi:hypothetical protein